MFNSVLSGLAVRYDLGALEQRILRDVFIVNMPNKTEVHTELCRSIKTPVQVYRIALSYERRDKYAKTYKVSSGGFSAYQIKTEPIKAIRGFYRRPF